MMQQARNQPERPYPVARRWYYLFLLSQLCCGALIILVMVGSLDIYLLWLVPVLLLLSVPYVYNAVQFLRNEQAEQKKVMEQGIPVMGTILSVERTSESSDEDYFRLFTIRIDESGKIVQVRDIVPLNTTMPLCVGDTVPLKYLPELDKALILFH